MIMITGVLDLVVARFKDKALFLGMAIYLAHVQ
jgi:hypothetical protein